MKTRLIIIISFLLAGIAVHADDKHEPPIKHVTVFTNGAQVERSMSLNLTAGEQVITFTGLSPYADTKSLQLRAHGKLTVIGVNYRKAHPDSAKQIQTWKDAQKKVKAADDKIHQLKAQREVVESQLEMVKTNCSVGNRTAVTPLAGIKELNDYYSQELLALKKKIISIDEEIEKATEEMLRLDKTADSIAHLKLTTVTEVDVKVEVPQACRAEFDFSYYVKNAGWYPTYDVRSESTSHPLQLSYKANVFQNTKEKWDKVPVTLSSANPNRSNIAPELRTYWLDYGRQAPRYDQSDNDNGVSGVVTDEMGDPIIGATVTVVGTKLGTVTDFEGHYSITLPKDNKQLRFTYIGYVQQTLRVTGPTLNVKMKEDNVALNEVTVVGYEVEDALQGRVAGLSVSNSSSRRSQKFTAPIIKKDEELKLDESEIMQVEEQKAQFGYEFDIKQPLTLLSNGKVTVTEIARYQLPAAYQYVGVPRADKEAFLVADATGWTSYSLLEGEANIYFDNSFVGKTIIDPNVPSDTLHFSLGRDNGIRIQRTKVADKSTRKLLASHQEQTMTWRITLKNTRNEAINMILKDQIPVSQNSGITVTTEELSGGNLDKEKGIVTWNINLQPNEQKDLLVQYRVKYPKNRRLVIE
ncbi:MAG: mucoidy inhibitor MuiA family protein [Prevotella sp.]|nr:mucoidy inhibitor MuiA family protein [Prevotella sp.]